MTTSFATRGASLKDLNIWDEDQVFTKKILLADGSIANPSIAFNSQNNIGIFKQGPGVLGFSADGVEVLRASGVLGSVNCFNMQPSTPGNSPVFEVAGTDPDIDLTFKPKGTGKVIIDSKVQINGGAPGVGKVLQSDADGLGSWTLPSGGGFTDAGATIILTNINDKVGIGTSSPASKLVVETQSVTNLDIKSGGSSRPQLRLLNSGGDIWNIAIGGTGETEEDSFIIRDVGAAIDRLLIDPTGKVGIGTLSPNAQLDVGGNPGASVGGFPSGQLHVTGQSAAEFANAVITGHNLFGGNKQLWYLGSGSSSNDDLVLINRQSGALSLETLDGAINFRIGGAVRATFTPAGHLHLLTDIDQKHNLKIKTANNTNASGIAWENSGGNFSQTIFRKDIGGNRSDLFFAIGSDATIDNLTDAFRIDGSVANLGNVEFFKKVGIGIAVPAEALDLVGNIKLTGQVLDVTIFAQLNSSIDQEPSDTNPVVITYNTQDAIAGLTHSTTVNAGEITIDTAGTYFVSPQPQVGKDSGGTKIDFDMFLQVDRGSGFVDEDNSNIKLAIKDADITDVIVSAFTIALSVGDKIRMMQKVSNSAVGMGLKNTDAVVGPPTVPRTPSIIFTMYRIGG